MDKRIIVFALVFVLSLFYFNSQEKQEQHQPQQPYQQPYYPPSQPQPPQQPQQPRLPSISVSKPSFKKYPELVEQLKTWEREAEDFVEVGTYGRTTQGNDNYYIRITNEMSYGDKPRVLVTGCIHGNEPISTTTVMWWIGSILSTYNQDREVTELVNTRELYFIPVICPDSYPHSRHCDGADPNRNFPSSGEKQSIPPIENFKRFFIEKQFKAFASGHSFGRVWLFAQDPSRSSAYTKIKQGVGSLTNYDISNLGGPGTTLEADWGARHGALSTIIEFGTHQRIPSDDDIRTEYNATYKAALYFMKEAPITQQGWWP